MTDESFFIRGDNISNEFNSDIMKHYKHQNITKKIIKGYYEVYNELGTGFLEAVYENALYMVLSEYGLEVEQQQPISVYFRGIIIGNYRADLIIEQKVLLELKAVRATAPEHKAQIIHYLKATNIDIGLLMNFGDEPEFRRFIFDKKANSADKHRINTDC